MSKDLAREKRIYLAIWRKALRDDQPELVLNFSDFNTALSVRMTMYRTIRPYREGKFFDSELKEAAEKYVLVTKREPPTILVVPRKSAEAAELLFADLGLDEMDLMTDEELAAMKIAERVQGGNATHQPNKFFGRESE